MLIKIPSKVFACRILDGVDTELEAFWLKKLDPSVAEWASSKRAARDRSATIVGRLLLAQALRQLGAGSIELKMLGRSEKSAPVVPPPFSGSIAHDSELVVAIAASSGSVGIDVEACHDAEAQSAFVSSRFAAEERAMLLSSNSQTHSFTELWVRKEAMAKATGRSLAEVMSLSVMENRVAFANSDWHFVTVCVPTGHCCAVAANWNPGTIQTQFVAIGDLL
ncbi:MAG: 4'-phosphopantetheinyl transferase superfamily protein [Edaphobacter sp.]|uniref:4'-phosphopantetheinyl transferase family protein n=1 Tax=Edaphobacter sp. TaxID=1934404 RepID=UPI002981EFC5|nr:4'-phosphopantetheinyl transferase superfamily protein [Edaphobacter sp.]MDW5265517.1 4'-phosphopantetheinyl transferase superfamily protein [Edaphobacter sp.]